MGKFVLGMRFEVCFSIGLITFLVVAGVILLKRSRMAYSPWYLRSQIIRQQEAMGGIIIAVLLLCIYFIFGIITYQRYTGICNASKLDNKVVVVGERESGILVGNMSSAFICKQSYVYCQYAKCPKLFTIVHLEQKEGTKSTKIRFSELPNLGTGVYFFLYYGNLFKEHAFVTLRNIYGKDSAALYISMLFGGSYVGKETYLEMKKAGLLHIVAVSGVNISIFLSFYEEIIKNVKKHVRLLIKFLFLFLFISISGFSPPTVRAILSGFSSLACSSLGQRTESWSLFPIVLLLCLLVFPNYLESVSFILTISAQVALLYICPLVTNFVSKLKLKVKVKQVTNMLLETFFIETTLLVVIYLYYKEFNIWGYVTSIATDPLVEGFSILGYLSFPFLMFGESVAQVCSVFVIMYIYLLEFLLQFWK